VTRSSSGSILLKPRRRSGPPCCAARSCARSVTVPTAASGSRVPGTSPPAGRGCSSSGHGFSGKVRWHSHFGGSLPGKPGRGSGRHSRPAAGGQRRLGCSGTPRSHMRYLESGRRLRPGGPRAVPPPCIRRTPPPENAGRGDDEGRELTSLTCREGNPARSMLEAQSRRPSKRMGFSPHSRPSLRFRVHFPRQAADDARHSSAVPGKISRLCAKSPGG
jgi:hypothetical protein